MLLEEVIKAKEIMQDKFFKKQDIYYAVIMRRGENWWQGWKPVIFDEKTGNFETLGPPFMKERIQVSFYEESIPRSVNVQLNDGTIIEVFSQLICLSKIPDNYCSKVIPYSKVILNSSEYLSIDEIEEGRKVYSNRM